MQNRYKLCIIYQTGEIQHEKKPVSNSKNKRSEGFEQIFMNCVEIFIP